MNEADEDSLGVWSPPRHILEKHYTAAVNNGWIPRAETEVEYWQATFADFFLEAEPKESWEDLSYELRLLNLQCEESVHIDTKGHADLARDLRDAADKIWDVVQHIGNLTHATSVNVAAMEQKVAVGEGIGAFLKERNRLTAAARWLEENPQRPRWRENAMRRARTILAIKATPVFEYFFDEKAKPAGGSHSRDIADCNDWTRFFQAIAFCFYHERITPDRQRVLWDAYGQTRTASATLR